MSINRWIHGVSPGLKSDAAHLLRVMCAHCQPENGLVTAPELSGQILDLAFYEDACRFSNSTAKRAIRELKDAGLIRKSGLHDGETNRVVIYQVTGAACQWDPQAFLAGRQGNAIQEPADDPLSVTAAPAGAGPPPPSPGDVQADATDQRDETDETIADEGPDGAGAELNVEEGPAEGIQTGPRTGEGLLTLAQRYADLTMSGWPQPDHCVLAMEDLLALGDDPECAVAITLEAAELLLQAAGREWLRNNGGKERELFLENVLRFRITAEHGRRMAEPGVDQAGYILKDIYEGLDCDKTALDRPFHQLTLAVLGLLAVGFDVDTAVRAVRSRLRASLQVVAAKWDEAHPRDEADFHRRSAWSRLEWALYGPDGDQSGQAGPL